MDDYKQKQPLGASLDWDCDRECEMDWNDMKRYGMGMLVYISLFLFIPPYLIMGSNLYHPLFLYPTLHFPKSKRHID
jgi:hypothetical protein